MSGLGNFSSLPPELRLMIWQSLLSNSLIPTLQASRQMHDEISGEYFARNFLIKVTGTAPPDVQLRGYCPECRRKRQIEWDSFGAVKYCTGCLENSYLIPRPLRCTTPLNRFRKTVIEVFPPDPGDPGQFVRLWSGLSQVVRIISQIPGQQIQVRFCEDSGHTWFKPHPDENPNMKRVQRSMPCQKSDLDYLVTLCFLFFQDALECSVLIPPIDTNGTAYHLEEFADLARIVAKERRLLFKRLSKVECKANIEHLPELDAIGYNHLHFVELDQMLDDLAGSSASFIRRDRLVEWPYYEREMLEILREKRAFSTLDTIYINEPRIYDIYRDRLVWERDTYWLLDDDGVCLAAPEGQRKRSRTLEVDWPEGIPPRGSLRWHQQMHTRPEFFDGALAFQRWRDEEDGLDFLPLEPFDEAFSVVEMPRGFPARYQWSVFPIRWFPPDNNDDH